MWCDSWSPRSATTFVSLAWSARTRSVHDRRCRAALPRRKQRDSRLLMKILFVAPRMIGDAVMASGILDRLVRQHPAARITVASSSRGRGALHASAATRADHPGSQEEDAPPLARTLGRDGADALGHGRRPQGIRPPLRALGPTAPYAPAHAGSQDVPTAFCLAGVRSGAGSGGLDGAGRACQGRGPDPARRSGGGALARPRVGPRRCGPPSVSRRSFIAWPRVPCRAPRP